MKHLVKDANGAYLPLSIGMKVVCVQEHRGYYLCGEVFEVSQNSLITDRLSLRRLDGIGGFYSGSYGRWEMVQDDIKEDISEWL